MHIAQNCAEYADDGDDETGQYEDVDVTLRSVERIGQVPAADVGDERVIGDEVDEVPAVVDLNIFSENIVWKSLTNLSNE